MDLAIWSIFAVFYAAILETAIFWRSEFWRLFFLLIFDVQFAGEVIT